MAVVNETIERIESNAYWDLPLYFAVCRFLAEAPQSMLDQAFHTAGGYGVVKDWINKCELAYRPNLERERRLMQGTLTQEEMIAYEAQHGLVRKKALPANAYINTSTNSTWTTGSLTSGTRIR
jgi:hypothetical protein